MENGGILVGFRNQ